MVLTLPCLDSIVQSPGWIVPTPEVSCVPESLDILLALWTGPGFSPICVGVSYSEYLTDQYEYLLIIEVVLGLAVYFYWK